MKKQQNNSTKARALQVVLSVTLLCISAALLAAGFNSTPGQASKVSSTIGQTNKVPKGDANTVTPIKHVIVIVGENRSFDHLFATYVAKPGNTVNNLLSEGIINADGSPGPHFSQATQFRA